MSRIKKDFKDQYISLKNYNLFKKNHFIIHDYDIEKHNNEYINKCYNRDKEYFDNICKEIDKDISLDSYQLKTVIQNEDYSLILAGAGTGKTTVIAAKVKYLIDKCHVNPDDILVLSYTKKATEELEAKIVLDMGYPCNVKTFHSLGYNIIKRLFSERNPYIIDENDKINIFISWLDKEVFTDKNKMNTFISSFNNIEDGLKKITFGNYFKENYHKFNSFNEYFEKYKIYRLNTIKELGLKDVVEKEIDQMINANNPKAIKGEIVKSKGEAIIANYLYTNGIDYEYEKVYDEIIEDYVVYKPDFTINIAGEKIYLEYFGLSNYKEDKLNRYNKIKEMKINFHTKKKNRFIAIDYMPNEDIINTIDKELNKYKVPRKHKSYEEIYLRMIDNNKIREFYKIYNLFYECIEKIKSNIDREQYNNIINSFINHANTNDSILYKNQYDFFNSFYQHYNKCIYGGNNYGFDFSDMLYYAKKYIDNERVNDYLNYKYIIVDEYQDISMDRFELLDKIVKKCNSKLCVVGDDWQSIYGFNGSAINYIINFKDFYNDTKIFSLVNTYRNSQELLNITGTFIMKNPYQLKKSLKSNKKLSKPIYIKEFNEDKGFYEVDALKNIIKYIYKAFPKHNILILARKNKNINSIFDNTFFTNDIGTKVTIKSLEDIEIDAMTMHMSKGLTYDEVIILGMNNEFPMDDINDYWIKTLFKPKLPTEPIKYPEERRIFYVALTRTRNRVFILLNKNIKNQSKFISELTEISEDKIRYLD